jgi:large subunit ribosomal protein L18
MKTLKRRQKECKTDYHKRIKLLKGNSPRIIFRKTNKYIISQYVTSKEAKDKVEFGISSKKLMDYGWPKEFSGSLKSIPASYFTGFLIGKKIVKEKLKKPILDLGMVRNIHKSKIYAFLKGLNDAGIDIQCDKKFFPDENRTKGKHMKNDISGSFEKIKSNIEEEN